MKKGSLKIGRKYSAANMIAYRYLTPTVKPERSYPGETRLSLSYVKIRITVHVTRHFAVRKLNELKRQESKRQNRRQSAKHVKLQSNLMQAGKERTFDSSGFLADRPQFLHPPHPLPGSFKTKQNKQTGGKREKEKHFHTR